jgi:hypothetical protein
VFDFMAYVKEKAQKKEHLEQLVAARALESEHVSTSEESALEDSDTETLVSECVDQVCCRDFLMH